MPVLPDVIQPGLKAVFCGVAAGNRSAYVGAYYAGRGNRFWDILWRVGLTPRVLAPSEFRCLLDYGLGLTDLAKNFSGNDEEVDRSSFDSIGLARKLEVVAPWVVAFNGKKAAQVFLCRQADYGLQPEMVGRTAIFVLPSTSGAARGFWDPKPWYALAEFLGQ
jgi:TDG/mug DNA glycosylase family protein